MKKLYDQTIMAKIMAMVLMIAFFSCDNDDVLSEEMTQWDSAILSKNDDKFNYNKKGHRIPNFEDAVFSDPTNIDETSYYPLLPGKVYVFETIYSEEDEIETIVVYRTSEIKIVNGITTVVQNDKVWVEGNLVENTDDWLAQDDDANLWYMGEESWSWDEDIEDWVDDGSWEAGVDGAMAGYWMPVNPTVGMEYYQEFYKQEAEDQAVVIETGVEVTIVNFPLPFENCLVTKDFTKLEPVEYELKYYAPGIGLIKEEKYEKNELTEIVELVAIQDAL